MGNIVDLDSPTIVSGFARRVPGPVRKFQAVAAANGRLVLRWQSPGGTPVSGYRIERTREGRIYELLAEVMEGFAVLDPTPAEPWFYRVVAFNSRGPGGSKWVCFYRRGDRFLRGGHNLDSLLQHIPVKSGLKVTICE